jgi:transposase-like protein
MSNVAKRLFRHEYRAEAVKFVINEGIVATHAARKLGLSVKTYSKWVRDARAARQLSSAAGERFAGGGESLEARIGLRTRGARYPKKKATAPSLGHAAAASRK